MSNPANDLCMMMMFYCDVTVAGCTASLYKFSTTLQCTDLEFALHQAAGAA